MEICGCTGCSSADPSEPDSSPSEYTDIFGDFIPPHLGRRDSQDIFKPAPPPSDDDVQWEDEGDTFERVTPQEHEMLRERFEAADTDASGKLEMGELRALLARLGVALSDAQLRAWMAKYDKDHDATIDLREFVGIFEHEHALLWLSHGTLRLAYGSRRLRTSSACPPSVHCVRVDRVQEEQNAITPDPDRSTPPPKPRTHWNARRERRSEHREPAPPCHIRPAP